MEPRIANDYAPQPKHNVADQTHPLYDQYCGYRSKMAAQLVTAMPFASWLAAKEEADCF